MKEYRILIVNEDVTIDFGYCDINKTDWWRQMLTKEGRSFQLISRADAWCNWELEAWSVTG